MAVSSVNISKLQAVAINKSQQPKESAITNNAGNEKKASGDAFVQNNNVNLQEQLNLLAQQLEELLKNSQAGQSSSGGSSGGSAPAAGGASAAGGGVSGLLQALLQLLKNAGSKQEPAKAEQKQSAPAESNTTQAPAGDSKSAGASAQAPAGEKKSAGASANQIPERGYNSERAKRLAKIPPDAVKSEDPYNKDMYGRPYTIYTYKDEKGRTVRHHVQPEITREQRAAISAKAEKLFALVKAGKLSQVPHAHRFIGPNTPLDCKGGDGCRFRPEALEKRNKWLAANPDYKTKLAGTM